MYSALTAIPATPVQGISDTIDIAFKVLGNLFIDIFPINIFKLVTLNTISNRSKYIATVMDVAVVIPVSSQ